MAFSRERIFPEREFQEGFKSAENLRGQGEVCPGYLNSALRDLPMVVLTN